MKKISTFALGLIIGICVTAGGTVGAATYLKATPKSVSLITDSKQTSVEAVTVNNKLYLPVRDAGNSFGYQVTDVTSSTVTFKAESSASNNSTTSTTKTGVNSNGGEYVKGLYKNFSTNGKLDANKIKLAIAAGEFSVNAQDSDSKNSLLHYAVLEDNFALYSAIKVNALNPNLQNAEGKTPLMLSVINESIFYFGELTNIYKSDATLKDNAGKTALDYATKGTSTYNGLQAYMM
ncbi:hypothetical protein [Paenibacillus sp. FSL H3-0333]|uniref:hypothetical protein n=1 Tax=Paenibacillus sp. FSL H3-0333 TaxID=2921373 RepID=UPI0030F73359